MQLVIVICLMSTATHEVSPTMWRTNPSRLSRLVVGLVVFGMGDALIVRSELGNSPWTVFAEGLSRHSPLSIGVASIAIGFALLLIWIPLGVRLGLGTVLNAILIGLAIDATLVVVQPAQTLLPRVALLLGGIGLIGLGSGLYLGTRHGPGPRDGLMTGLHTLTHRPISMVRAAIELTALTAGFLLGGTVGVGTVAFAILVGPAVQVGLGLNARLLNDPSG